MGKKAVKALEITILTGLSIWLAVTTFLWAFGLGMFIFCITKPVYQEIPFVNFLLSWLVWGLFCVIPSIKYFWRTVKSGTQQGVDEGSRHLTTNVTVTKTSVSAETHDHKLIYGIMGFVMGLLGGLIIGPVVTLFIMIKYITKVVKQAKVVRKLYPKGTKKSSVPQPTVTKDDPQVENNSNVTPVVAPVTLTKKEDSNEVIKAQVLDLFQDSMGQLDDRFVLDYEEPFDVKNNEHLIIERYQIIKDTLSEKLILRLSIKNISKVKIKGAVLEIIPQANDGSKLGVIKDINFDGQVLDVNQSGYMKKGIILPPECVQGEIRIKSVIFEDDLSFDKTNEAYRFLTQEKFDYDLKLYNDIHNSRK